MKSSVIIPVYNGLGKISKTLENICKYKFDEIICVNDCSSDSSAEYIVSNYPNVKLINNKKNLRFPKTVNKGVSSSKGELIYLFNQDAYPEKIDLKVIEKYFLEDTNLFAITFNEQHNSWAKAKFKDGFMEFTNGEIDSSIHESFWPSGGSSVISRNKWDILGGFDELFTPGYFEDFDLGWKANNRGWKTIWDPSLKVSHLQPESTFKSTFESKYLQRIKDRNYLLAHWNNLRPNQYPLHFINLFKRCIKSPGYTIPLLMAIKQICLK